MSEVLCVREHHHFLPESSVLIWLKPLKGFYSLSLIWWQETRLCIPFIVCWFYKLTCSKCMYNLCFAWHFSVNVTENMHSLCFYKNMLSLEKGEWDDSLNSKLEASSLYFIQFFLARKSSYRSEKNAIHLWHWATEHRVIRFGNPGEVPPIFPLQSTG